MLRVQVITSEKTKKAIRLSGERGGKLVEALPGLVASAATQLASDLVKSEFGPSGSINTVSGNLSKSIGSRVEVSAGSVIAYIGVQKGPTSVYARIQEEGGVIRAKPRKALAIPLSPMKTGRGTLREEFQGKTPREVGDKYDLVFIDRRKQGKPPLLAKVNRVPGKKQGKATSIEPWYVLLKSVKIKPKRYLSGGVQRNFPAFHVSLRDDIGELLSAK